VKLPVVMTGCNEKVYYVFSLEQIGRALQSCVSLAIINLCYCSMPAPTSKQLTCRQHRTESFVHQNSCRLTKVCSVQIMSFCIGRLAWLDIGLVQT